MAARSSSPTSFPFALFIGLGALGLTVAPACDASPDERSGTQEPSKDPPTDGSPDPSNTGDADATFPDDLDGDVDLDAPPVETDAASADAHTEDAGPSTPPDPSAHPDGFARLRIVAGNLSTDGQKYGEPGIHILRALEPDVALLQEVKYGSSTEAEIRSFVDDTFGHGFRYTRGPGGIPNGVVSRYPLLDAGSWTDTKVTDRTFVWAKIDVPGDIDLLAVSVHLLTSNPSSRNTQAGEIVTNVKAMAPSGTYVVVGGDFNTTSRDESCIHTFSELFATNGPYPSYAGNENTNATRNKPYDWVLPNTLLDANKTAVVLGSQTFASGLVFDSRAYEPLAEVPPVVAGDSGASGMQHMAVVRDFMLPGVAEAAQ